MPEPSDKTLVERVQKGDQVAFRQLVERYQRKVYSLCFGMVHNREDALDLTQEAFVKVHRYLDQFQGDSSFYTWLYRIAANLAIDHLRREAKRRGQADYDDAIDHTQPDQGDFPLVSPSATETPSRTLQRKELAQQIGKALDVLSHNHREILLLREVDGLSYTELAEVLKIHKGTVMSRLHHARRNFQAAIEDYLDGSTP